MPTRENDSNTLRVDVYCFENGEKNIRFQKYPDSFARGLRLCGYSCEVQGEYKQGSKIIISVFWQHLKWPVWRPAQSYHRRRSSLLANYFNKALHALRASLFRLPQNSCDNHTHWSDDKKLLYSVIAKRRDLLVSRLSQCPQITDRLVNDKSLVLHLFCFACGYE